MKMKTLSKTGNRSFCLSYRTPWLVSMAAVLLMTMGISNVLAKDSPTAAPASLRVYVDTESLALSSDPAAGRVPLDLSIDTLRKLNTSSEGLTPVTQNGVTRIDFKGRYQPVWVAVTDAEGKVRPFCLTGLPQSLQLVAMDILASHGEEQ